MKIYIFGAGDYGQRLYRWIFENNICNIVGFVQTSTKECNEINGIHIYSIAEVLIDCMPKVFLLAINNKDDINDIKTRINIEGNHKVIDCSGFIRDNIPPYSMSRYCILCGNYIEEFKPFFVANSELFKKKHIIGAGYRQHCSCPYCQGIDRNRWFYYVMERYTEISSCKGKVLHFAPAGMISKIYKRKLLGNYITADIENGRADIVVDITDIQFRDNSFDYVIANHVLEHVADEELAIKELKRIIKDNGSIILSFPLCMDIDTVDGNENMTAEERLREFGQEDHIRLYGRDYLERIEKYGLKIDVYSPQSYLSEEEIDRFGFIPDDVVLVCKMTQSGIK